MAKKAKTPPPPRRVQAPKTRTGGDDGRRARLILYVGAASGLIALAAVLAVIFAGGSGGGGTNVAALMKDAGCTYKDVPASVPKGEDTHVNSLSAPIQWNTFPPSNGQHYPRWAVWDFYSEPVNPRLVVHNLEHGGIVLWWGTGLPQDQVDRLHAFYTDDPVSMLGTPIEGFDSKVAIAAWTGDATRYTRDGYYGEGHLAVCPRFDDKTEKAFAAFRDAFRGKGPEGVPAEQNQPGSGPG